MVAEAMIRMNQINLYDIHGNVSRTLIFQDAPQGVNEVEQLGKRNRYKYFGPIIAKNNYFGALYYNIHLKDYYERKGAQSSILFFDWEGNPLIKVEIPYQAENFFVWKNNLYVFANDAEEEAIYKYQIDWLPD